MLFTSVAERVLRLDGSRLEVFVKGLRNSVGFDWHPVTGEFFFTETVFPDSVKYSPRFTEFVLSDRQIVHLLY